MNAARLRELARDLRQEMRAFQNCWVVSVMIDDATEIAAALEQFAELEEEREREAVRQSWIARTFPKKGAGQ